MQKLLTLIIGGVILYCVVQARMQEKTDQTPNVTEQNNVAINAKLPSGDVVSKEQPADISGNFLEKTISKVVINALKTEEGRIFFENILQPANQTIADANYTIKLDRDIVAELFQIKTLGDGVEGRCLCGNVVTIKYQIMDMQDRLLKEDVKTYSLGFRPIMPGIDNVVVGMMIGQTRQAIIPQKYAYFYEFTKDATDIPQFLKVNLKLESILPKNIINFAEIKIFDNEIAYKIPILCGDKISYDAKITLLSKGEVIYSSVSKGKKIEMKVGDITYPMIFSLALHGKIPVGTRTVITKGKYFKSLGSNMNKIISQNLILNDEYYMLELNNFNFIQ